MKQDIELRDFFAAQLMSGKVGSFFRQKHRENIAGEKETEIWKQVSSEEATRRQIEKSAAEAYKISDVMLKVRELTNSR